MEHYDRLPLRFVAHRDSQLFYSIPSQRTFLRQMLIHPQYTHDVSHSYVCSCSSDFMLQLQFCTIFHSNISTRVYAHWFIDTIGFQCRIYIDWIIQIRLSLILLFQSPRLVHIFVSPFFYSFGNNMFVLLFYYFKLFTLSPHFNALVSTFSAYSSFSDASYRVLISPTK